jgi:folate-binding protein YgfZ
MTYDGFQQLLSQGGVIDLSPRTKIKLQGPDRTRYLQGQVTNDVSKLEAGQVIEACLCNAKGKLEAHVFIRELTEPLLDAPGETQNVYLIDADPVHAEDDFLLNRLDKYLIADDCELVDVTGEFDLVHTLEPSTPPSGERSDGPLFHANRFGVPGTEILTGSGRNSEIIDDDTPTTPLDWELLRITHGIPAWGRELTSDILPPVAGAACIERNICYTKGCYIGQETISRLKSVGRVNKQLVTLVTLSAPHGLDPGPTWNLFPESPASNDPKPIGRLTSTSHSPLLDTVIALGYLKRDFLKPGTRVCAAPAGSSPNISSCATLEIRETPIR